MARTFKLDATEDWALEGPPGQLDLVLVSDDDPEFVRAMILGRLPVQRGTWRYDPTLGIGALGRGVRG